MVTSTLDNKNDVRNDKGATRFAAIVGEVMVLLREIADPRGS